METEIKEKKKLFDILREKTKTIIGVLLIILISISIYSWMKFQGDIKKKDLSERYIEAKILLSQKKNDDSLKILKDIISEEDSTYSILSLYLIIDKNLENNNEKILDYFKKILLINDLEKEEINLIRLKQAIFISSFSQEEELLELLNPIINSDSVWKAQSIKFLADYYFSRKEYQKADQYYSKLINLQDNNLDNSEIKRKTQTYKK